MTPEQIEAVIAGLDAACPICHGAKEVQGRRCTTCVGRGYYLTTAGTMLLAFLDRYRDRLWLNGA